MAGPALLVNGGDKKRKKTQTEIKLRQEDTAATCVGTVNLPRKPAW